MLYEQEILWPSQVLAEQALTLGTCTILYVCGLLDSQEYAGAFPIPWWICHFLAFPFYICWSAFCLHQPLLPPQSMWFWNIAGDNYLANSPWEKAVCKECILSSQIKTRSLKTSRELRDKPDKACSLEVWALRAAPSPFWHSSARLLFFVTIIIVRLLLFRATMIWGEGHWNKTN